MPFMAKNLSYQFCQIIDRPVILSYNFVIEKRRVCGENGPPLSEDGKFSASAQKLSQILRSSESISA